MVSHQIDASLNSQATLLIMALYHFSLYQILATMNTVDTFIPMPNVPPHSTAIKITFKKDDKKFLNIKNKM